VTAVYELAAELALSRPGDADFLHLIEDDRYYRTRPMDEHEVKGETDNMKLVPLHRDYDSLATLG
jgi:hypothetical protein